jgi:hypothetical protein
LDISISYELAGKTFISMFQNFAFFWVFFWPKKANPRKKGAKKNLEQNKTGPPNIPYEHMTADGTICISLLLQCMNTRG